MKKIFLVRHGETVGNINHTWQDSTDELTPRGFIQADKLAERLEGNTFDQAFCSSFLRAKQTSEAISKRLGLTFIFSDLFTEVKNPSSTIGERYEKIPGNVVYEYIQKRDSAEDRDNFRLEDEETFTELIARARKALQTLAEAEGETILAVTHGTFMRTLVGVVLSQHEPTRPSSEIFYGGRFMQTINTGITVLTYDEEKKVWSLLTFNDHAHFAE
jgi:broad specificity phosphatase PhoE